MHKLSNYRYCKIRIVAKQTGFSKVSMSTEKQSPNHPFLLYHLESQTSIEKNEDHKAKRAVFYHLNQVAMFLLPM